MRFFLQNANTPNAYWVAQDTDGTLYFFGSTATGQGAGGENANPDALICNETGEQIFRWNLVLVEDVHGNRVRYVYEKGFDGQSYLSDVYYNNHPTDPTKYQHHVEVSYEGRDDELTSFQTGFPVSTEKRIASISVYTDYGCYVAVPKAPLVAGKLSQEKQDSAVDKGVPKDMGRGGSVRGRQFRSERYIRYRTESPKRGQKGNSESKAKHSAVDTARVEEGVEGVTKPLIVDGEPFTKVGTRDGLIANGEFI
jgi:hypothetical protein